MSNRDNLPLRGKSKPPVQIRRNVATGDESGRADDNLTERSLCRECHSFYSGGRWHTPDQKKRKQDASDHELNLVLCPACRKLKDRAPNGVVRLTGQFVLTHKEEILNLIRNQTRKGDSDSPHERIMTMETIPDGMEITTTDDRLAQRIGRAVQKAYSGEVEYKWSPDERFARVNWSRNE